MSIEKWRAGWIADAWTIESIEQLIFDDGSNHDTITMSTVSLPNIIVEDRIEPLRQSDLTEQRARRLITSVMAALVIFIVFYTLAHL